MTIYGLDKLSALKVLDLSRNQITVINGLDKLSALKVLDLSDNQITVINGLDKLSALTRLNDLIIHNNPFVASSDLVLTPYTNHLSEIKALFDKAKGDKYPHQPFCKVMLLGNHQSGKSTFLKEYDTSYKYRGSTHVLSVHRSRDSKAIFYDFGGQDYYHGIYQAFFTDQSLHLLFWHVASDCNKVALDTIGYQTLHFDRSYWLGQIDYARRRRIARQGGGKNNAAAMDADPDTIMIQTYADEEGQQTLGSQAGNSVLEEVYVSLTSEVGSAILGRQYLNKRVQEIIQNRSNEIMITEKDKFLFDNLPEIAALYNEKPISLTDLAKELNSKWHREDSFDQEYLQTELNQLSLRGEVLYYRENERLNGYVWLAPAALVQMIHAKVLKKELINQGRIKKEELKNTLATLCPAKQADEKSCPNLLQLLLEEQIIYEDKEVYVIPGYLPLHTEDEAYRWLTLGFSEPNLCLKFEHFIPFGLINQIITYYGREVGALKRYWRDQVIFTTGQTIEQPSHSNFEEREKSTKGRSSEDYLVWIKLDFTDLSISVYIKKLKKVSEKELKQQEATILNDILDMYWDNIPPRDKIDDPKMMDKRASIRNIYRKENPIEDLYLSYADADKELEKPHYIHLGTLDDETTTNKIAAYPLRESGGKRSIDREKVREVSTRPYKHLSINPNLSGIKRVFISYSKYDHEELETCLLFLKPLERSGLIEIYYDEVTKFETPIHSEIRRRIENADCIIALVSQRYLCTDYILDHELPIIEDNEKTLIPIQIKPCTFYDVEMLAKHYFALKAKVINFDHRVFQAHDSTTASALRDENWVAVVNEFKEKILGKTKQEVKTNE